MSKSSSSKSHQGSTTNQQQEPPFLLYKNVKCPSFDEGLDSIVNLLKDRKNIAVLLGAGISVSCGIPDFRTKGSGLYSTLDAEDLGISCPEELFDASFFHENPRPFYKFARNLYYPRGINEPVHPSDSHKLLALLDAKKMLRRCYSQNIDGLEEMAGVSSKKIVCAHGSLRWATCCKCKRKVNCTEIEKDIINGTVAYCQAPSSSNSSSKNNAQVQQQHLDNNSSERYVSLRTSSRKRNRSAINSTSEVSPIFESNEKGICGGVMKPGITFFGETLNTNVKRCLESDRNKVDALIVIGTSLSVAPISKVIGYLPPNIPRILINREIVHPKHAMIDEEIHHDTATGELDFRKDYVFDAYMLGYCDDVTRILGRLLFSDDNRNKDNNSKDNNDNKKRKLPRCTKAYGKLLATLHDDDNDEFCIKDWKMSTKVPHDRVFLFPGAQTTTTSSSLVTLAADNMNQCSSKKVIEEPFYREVVYCDGCTQRIYGIIQKCVSCFDYDLCQQCYPILSKTHHEGKHHFIAETGSWER